MTEQFDDTRLDDPVALEGADDLLRELAGAGARVRAEIDAAGPALEGLGPDGGFRPRAVVAAGRDARLVRAVLEPVCPVPFVGLARAEPAGLVRGTGPGRRAGGLAGGPGGDLCGRRSGPARLRPAGRLAERSTVGELAAGVRHAIRLPSQSDDTLATAVAVLQALHQLELGPAVEAAAVADTLDEVAVACSPQLDVAANPAKDLALMLADALPLIWGGSVLSAGPPAGWSRRSGWPADDRRSRPTPSTCCRCWPASGHGTCSRTGSPRASRSVPGWWCSTTVPTSRRWWTPATG